MSSSISTQTGLLLMRRAEMETSSYLQPPLGYLEHVGMKILLWQPFLIFWFIEFFYLYFNINKESLFGQPLVSLWFLFGSFLVPLWSLFASYLVPLCFLVGPSLVSLWSALGLSLVPLSSLFGPFLVPLWSFFGKL